LANGDPHTSDGRLAATDIRHDRDPIEFHGTILKEPPDNAIGFLGRNIDRLRFEQSVAIERIERLEQAFRG